MISHLLLHLLREKTHSPHAPTPTLKDHGRRFTLSLPTPCPPSRVCSFYAITSLSPSGLLFPTIFSCDHPLALSFRSVFLFHSHFISFSLSLSLFLSFSLGEPISYLFSPSSYSIFRAQTNPHVPATRASGVAIREAERVAHAWWGT